MHSDTHAQYVGAEMEIQIDNCPPFSNYGSHSVIKVLHPYVETSTVGGLFKKRIPTGVTRYEIEFKVIDGMLNASQLWFAPFNSTGVDVGLQKPSIFQFRVIGTDVDPLTLVGLLQLKEYETIITGAIEFTFIFTGTLPIGMPESATPVIPQLNPVPESPSETYSESLSWSPSEEIPESESPSAEVTSSIEIPTPAAEPSIQVPKVRVSPLLRLPKKPFKEEPPIDPEPKPKRKVSFQ